MSVTNEAFPSKEVIHFSPLHKSLLEHRNIEILLYDVYLSTEREKDLSNHSAPSSQDKDLYLLFLLQLGCEIVGQ